MSGSLLLIAAVWLVLLAPLLLRNQRPVRRTAQALSETRVLHVGGSVLKGRRRLKPAASLYSPADDEELELVDAEPEYVLVDDESGEHTASEAPATKPSKLKGKGKGADKAAAKKPGADTDADTGADIATVDAEIVEESENTEDAQGVRVSANRANQGENAQGASEQGVFGQRESDSGAGEQQLGAANTRERAAELEILEGEVVGVDNENGSDSDNSEAATDTADTTASTTATKTVADSSKGASAQADVSAHIERESAADAEQARRTQRRTSFDSVPSAVLRGGDIRPEDEFADAVAPHVDEAQRSENEDGGEELTAADLEYVNSRRGRGVFDPVASQRLALRRQQRRKQVLMVLCGLCVLTLGLAVTLGSGFWMALCASAGFTAFYLYLLRRQALEEQKLRQRRMARMRRARLGVRNTEDDELGVPDRLVRPGAVIVESDEIDPEFDHLEFVDRHDYFTDYFTTEGEEKIAARYAEDEYLEVPNARTRMRAV